MKQKGFTLIELLVVISIIVILTAVVLANIGTSQAKSRDTKRISDISQLNLAIAQVFEQCNRYPISIAVASLSTTVCTSLGGDSISLGSFLNKIPTDPKTNQEYGYAYYSAIGPGAGALATDYHMWTTLEKGDDALRSKANFSSVAASWYKGGTAYACTTSLCMNAGTSANSMVYDVNSKL